MTPQFNGRDFIYLFFMLACFIVAFSVCDRAFKQNCYVVETRYLAGQ